MKRLLMLFLMVITAVTGVHAEIMTGKERGINYAYNTDTYTMTFWGNGKMGDYGGYDYGTVSPFDVNGIFAFPPGRITSAPDSLQIGRKSPFT